LRCGDPRDPSDRLDALGKIVAAALIGGAGVTIVFGVLLIGLRFSRNSGNEGSRLLGWALAGVCGIFCVGAAVLGIVAMTHKPASKAKKAHKAAAALTAPEHRSRLVA
jgi:hypothetical protein